MCPVGLLGDLFAGLAGNAHLQHPFPEFLTDCINRLQHPLLVFVLFGLIEKVRLRLRCFFFLPNYPIVTICSYLRGTWYEGLRIDMHPPLLMVTSIKYPHERKFT